MGSLCVALDSPQEQTVYDIVDATAPYVDLFKVGFTSFSALGPAVVGKLSSSHPVFLDLKLHDIPAQVAGAVSAVAATGASYTTLHASGGEEMVRAGVEAAGGDVIVLAVTVLTSLDRADLGQLGFDPAPGDLVLRLAELALEAGAPGLVCSPLEITALRERFGTLASGGPLLVVPGIRPAGSATDDQRRTLGPLEAVEAGADIIVVGRPITGALDPGAAARTIARSVRT